MGGTERGFRNSPGGDFASVPRSTAHPQENFGAVRYPSPPSPMTPSPPTPLPPGEGRKKA